MKETVTDGHQSPHKSVLTTTIRFVSDPPLPFTIIAFLLISLPLVLLAANPFDLATITGPAARWLQWGSPFYLFTKFGLPYQALIISEVWSARFVAPILHISGVAAIHLTFKAPLLLAAIIAAILIEKLAVMVGLSHPRRLAALWLLNPVTIWVAAGHGQIEPVALALTLLALWLCFTNRWGAAGVIVGLGASFEYFPIIVVCVAVFAIYHRILPFRRSLRFFTGLTVSLLVFYGPLFLFPGGGSSILSGIFASGSQGPGVIQTASLWSYLASGPFSRFTSLWPITLLVFILVIGYLLRRSNHEQWERDALLLVGFTLVAFTVLYPSSLPQFNLICVMALILLVDRVRGAIAAIIFLPLISYIGFFFGTSMYQFYSDINPVVTVSPGVSGLLPVFPNDQYLSYAFTIIALYGYLFILSQARRATQHRNSLSRLTTTQYPGRQFRLWGQAFSAIGIAVFTIPTALILIVACQPQFLSNVSTRGPSLIADYSSYVNPIGRYPMVLQGDGLVPNMPAPQQMQALQRMHGRSRPQINIGVNVAPVINTNTQQGADLREGYLEIPNWTIMTRAASSLWVEFLMTAKTNGRAASLPFSISIANRRYSKPSQEMYTNPGWYVVVYRIPASSVTPSGRLSVRMESPDVYLDGSRSRSLWAMVFPAVSQVKLFVGNREEYRWYVGDDKGAGMIENVWPLVGPTLPVHIDGVQLVDVIAMTRSDIYWPSPIVGSFVYS